ncbi:MAG: S9 family peptidase [Saprospiraceae bacterium]|nr:S9 family peptidase [Saprospiraceae bacterium]
MIKQSLKIAPFVLLGLGVACNTDQSDQEKFTSQMLEKKDLQQPIAKKEAKELTIHNDSRIDNYYWMNKRDSQDVINYLNSENEYTDQMMNHLDGFQDELFNEIKGRIKQNDMSVPYDYNGYTYITRYEEGKEYAIYERKAKGTDAVDLMIDANKEAEAHDYYSIGGRSVSPDNKILAYGEDIVSRRIYTVRFKNLETGEMMEDVIPNTTGSVTWANDNKTIFYAKKDEALRSYKIFKHKLGTSADKDVEVYHEADETFSTYVYKTKSQDYIIIASFQTISTEFRVVSANNPDEAFKIFQPRERNLEYSIDHFEDKWYVITNLEAKNFRLMECALDNTSKENWKEVVAHREDVLLEGMDIFQNYMVLSERKNGINQIRVMSWNGEEHYIDFKEDAYMAYTSTNLDFKTDNIRLGFTSLTTPNTVFEYDMNTKAFTTLKETEVLGDFDKNNYKSERIYVTARDGAQVPVSLVYHKDTPIDGTAPCLLYGYGSYGASMDPYFSSSRLSLLDRGFVYAIGHIRGGQEMGRGWYEDGKLLNKKNTFNDFVDCGRHLVDNSYAAPDNLFAMGGSAGGLLMGAIVNQAPELWKGIISAVPFVDVVTTMLDESIPLTTGEYDEWGNPNDETYYNYIKSYSPYDNIEAKDYPSMLITTGYHDSQVQYFEPAKYVAKLRELKTDDNPLLFHINMDAGHGGQSGRFRRFKETAMEYAFFLDLAGKAPIKQ